MRRTLLRLFIIRRFALSRQLLQLQLKLALPLLCCFQLCSLRRQLCLSFLSFPLGRLLAPFFLFFLDLSLLNLLFECPKSRLSSFTLAGQLLLLTGGLVSVTISQQASQVSAQRRENSLHSLPLLLLRMLLGPQLFFALLRFKLGLLLSPQLLFAPFRF